MFHLKMKANKMDKIEDTGDHLIDKPLFQSIRVGRHTLSHRVVLAPVTRCRALDSMPQLSQLCFYTQRASPGGLLISEAVAVSPQAFGFPHSPGIFTKEQVQAWSALVDAVHAKGAIIYCQLWHVGRASHTYYQPNNDPPISSTNNKIPDPMVIRMPVSNGIQNLVPFSKPRALTLDEIANVIEDFRQAARNAMLAGFDGVEIHGAHGYILDQFLKDGINDRDDMYGGTIENRCRFAMEVLGAVVNEIGADRTAIRISPFSAHNGASDSNPRALYTHLLTSYLNELGLAYIHFTVPGFNAIEGRIATPEQEQELHDHLVSLASSTSNIVMCSGGFTNESGTKALLSGSTHLISYGRLYISNPDLPLRFLLDAPLNPYDRSTFYTHDPIKGYTDYPTLSMDSFDPLHIAPFSSHPLIVSQMDGHSS